MYGTTRPRPARNGITDAVQQLILAELPIDGATRKVLMQANKNGFFHVLDRQTGKLISAQNFTPVNWASGIDPKTGRPVENSDIRYDKTGKPFSAPPGALGSMELPGALVATVRQAMAFNPKTGLVYIPAQEIGMVHHSVQGFPDGVNRLEHSAPPQLSSRCQGVSDRLGSRAPEGGVARQLFRPMERRRYYHRHVTS